MEYLFLVPIIGLLLIYALERERNFVYRQWLAELDFFKRRLAVYEQLKSAAEDLHTSGAVSRADLRRFAQAMSDMRFLFDEDVERFVGDIYEALLKKHALDALLDKATRRAKQLTDQAVTDKALKKSRELAGRINDGIYRDMPKHMEAFLRPRPVSSPRVSIPTAPPSRYSKNY